MKNVLEMQEFKGIAEAIEDVKKASQDGFQFKDLKVYIGSLAIAIESCGMFMAKQGDEKKALLAKCLNHAIDIPWIPERIEGIIFSFVVNSLTNIVVKQLKKKGWNLDALK